MKRFKFHYELKRDPEVGEEIIEAKDRKEAQEEFDKMVESEPHDLAHQACCHTPEFYEIKVTHIKELDANT